MFTSVFPALETSKSPCKTGAQISYYKQKGWERKAGFYGRGSRQDNDFLSHVSVASLVHTVSKCSFRREAKWMLQCMENPEEGSKACLQRTDKSNPLKADRPSMEVPCYPRVWSLLHALSSKRSENQVASSCTAHNLCLAEVLSWDGCCYLCKVKWHCPDWLRVSLWNPEGLKPICPQGSRNGCNAGMSVRYNISGSLVLPSLQETSALCQRHLLHPVPTPWHWGLFMQNCSQLPWDLCLDEDSAKQTHYI